MWKTARLVEITILIEFYGEKLSRVERSPFYQSYSGRANFSYISLQNLTNRLHEKQKVGMGRRKDDLPRRGNFSPYKHFGLASRSTRLRQDDLSMRSQLLTRAKESTFFAYELTRDNFSPYKRDLGKHFRFVWCKTSLEKLQTYKQ